MAKKTDSNEPEYTIAELSANAESIFNASPDIVTAALTVAKVTSISVDAAKTIVNNFRKKEID